AAYFIEYLDGFRATLLMLDGAVKDFCFAARLRGQADPVSTQFLLTPVPNVTYSACLAAKIEEMFVTGRARYPVERSLLVCRVPCVLAFDWPSKPPQGRPNFRPDFAGRVVGVFDLVAPDEPLQLPPPGRSPVPVLSAVEHLADHGERQHESSALDVRSVSRPP